MKHLSVDFLFFGSAVLCSAGAVLEGEHQMVDFGDVVLAGERSPTCHGGLCPKVQATMTAELDRAGVQHMHLLQVGSSNLKTRSPSGELQHQDMTNSTNVDMCEANALRLMAKLIAPDCVAACPQICTVLESVLRGVQQGRSLKAAVCEGEAEATSCALQHFDACQPALERAEMFGIVLPDIAVACTAWGGSKGRVTAARQVPRLVQQGLTAPTVDLYKAMQARAELEAARQASLESLERVLVRKEDLA